MKIDKETAAFELYHSNLTRKELCALVAGLTQPKIEEVDRLNDQLDEVLGMLGSVTRAALLLKWDREKKNV